MDSEQHLGRLIVWRRRNNFKVNMSKQMCVQAAIMKVASYNYVAHTVKFVWFLFGRSLNRIIYFSVTSLYFCFKLLCSFIHMLKMNGMINNWWFAPNERARIICSKETYSHISFQFILIVWLVLWLFKRFFFVSETEINDHITFSVLLNR